MKIEKLSDNKIRCTLTAEDLEQRGLKLSELAYGTDKAKELFRDMMQQAQYMYGFRAENTPLMIEAIPMAGGTIVLIVTKVENPEELDTRFSSFASSVRSDPMHDDHASSIFEQLMETIRSASDSGEDAENESDGSRDAVQRASGGGRGHGGLRRQDIRAYQAHLMTHRMYAFPSMSAAAEAARHVVPGFTGMSTLIQDTDNEDYCLFIEMRDVQEVDAMQSRLAALSEYGGAYMSPYARMEYVREHGRMILAAEALETLARL